MTRGGARRFIAPLRLCQLLPCAFEFVLGKLIQHPVLTGPSACAIDGTCGLARRRGCAPAALRCACHRRGRAPTPPFPGFAVGCVCARKSLGVSSPQGHAQWTPLCVRTAARCSVQLRARCADSALFLLSLSPLTQAPCDFSSLHVTDPTHLHKTAPCRQLEK